jgi:hypothetical protein
VHELYVRYRRQVKRAADYRTLGGFLAFVALFLGVLYSQRQANTAFKVRRGAALHWEACSSLCMP